MRYYIAGPMAGYEDLNRAAFDVAKARLIEAGHDVISPADISRALPLGENEMRAIALLDIHAMLQCGAVFMLRRWEASRGARAEHAVALWTGIRIHYQQEEG